MKDLFDVSGKVALVTGGSRGIGEMIAEGFVTHGVKTYISARKAESCDATAERLSGIGECISIPADLSTMEGIDHLVDEIKGREKKLDILVNNAGIAGPNATTWEYPVEAWHEVMNVNLHGPYNCCRAVVPSMIAQNYGRIVSIASIAGKEGNPNAAAYSVSKAGVIALTKSLAKELADYDISVNAITPAAARTAIFDQMTQEHIDYMLSKIPLGRFGTSEEVAAMVAWLCSPECSFSTGAVFDLSGGRATY